MELKTRLTSGLFNSWDLRLELITASSEVPIDWYLLHCDNDTIILIKFR